MERQTAQSAAAVAERRVMEEKVKSGRELIMEEGGISGEMRRLDVKIGVTATEGAAEEEERRRRHRRLRCRRRKQRAKETITVTARTVTMMRMLGLRFFNGDERRGVGGEVELETVVKVSDPTTFSDNGEGGEAIFIVRKC